MSFITPFVAEQLILKLAINQTAATDLKLRLFVNNITPSDTDVLGSYTECSTSGYSAISLAGVSWTVSTVSSITSATFATQTFTLTAAATIYGCYLTDAAGSALFGSQRFDAAPFSIPTPGGSISVTPQITLAHS